MSIMNRHNYKTFSKSPPISLVHCIENVLRHSFGKCRDSLAIAGLSSTILYNIYSLISPQEQHNYKPEKKMIPNTSLSSASRTSLWYSKRRFYFDN